VAENLKINPALLSRFDLVFMLLDQPNEERDNQMAEHRNIRSRTNREASASKFVALSNQSTDALFATTSNRANPDISQTSLQLPETSLIAEKNLTEQLKLRPNEQIDNLPYILMQKYILHAQKHCHPKISKEAGQAISTFYIELRQMQIGSGAIPVTTR
jgi:DNA helicase MCM8